ncbi:hypothetical protein IFT64_12170 [Oxalobacteraceae sp. CFBP 8753]|nr:hypothetical protein [Oxalobacteraceae sp. CFBP 8753]
MEHALPRRTAGIPRSWSLLLTSENHGAVGPLGSTFPHAGEKHERVQVVEIVAAGSAPAPGVDLAGLVRFGFCDINDDEFLERPDGAYFLAHEVEARCASAAPVTGQAGLVAAPLPAGPVRIADIPSIEITLRQAKELVATFGGHDAEISIFKRPAAWADMDDGLYAFFSDYPDEGSMYLGATDVDDDLAMNGEPMGVSPQADWISAVVLDVAELPDRDSPEEWPEAMLVTGDELRTLIALHASAATLSPLCGTQHAATGDRALLAALAEAADVFMKGGVAPLRPLIDRAKAVAAQQAAAPGALSAKPSAYAIHGIVNGKHRLHDVRQIEPGDGDNWKIDDGGLGDYWSGNEPLFAPSAPGTPEAPQTAAARDVLTERQRQIQVEGWKPEHDDAYTADQLPRAAHAYILGAPGDPVPRSWPWSGSWWKPRDARANYVRAGALLMAEIERLDRAAAPKGGV